MTPGTSLTSTVLSTSGEDGAWNQPDSTVLSTSGEDGAWNQPDSK